MLRKFLWAFLLCFGAVSLSAQQLHYAVVLRSPADSSIVIQKLQYLHADSIQVVAKGKVVRATGDKSINDSLNAGIIEPYGIGRIFNNFRLRDSSGHAVRVKTKESTMLQYYVVLQDDSVKDQVIKKLKAEGADSFEVFHMVIRFVGPYKLNAKLKADFLKPLATGQQDKVAFLQDVSDSHLPPLFVNGVDWGISYMHAPDAWAMGANGTGYNIMDIDSGFGPNPYANIIGGHAVQGSLPPVVDTLNLADDRGACGGHGTHTMGTAVGNLASGVGVAPGAGGWVVKIVPPGSATIYSGCSLYTSNADIAIQWAIQHSEMHFVAYNMSYETSFGGPSEATLAAARAAGIIGCAAMGNSGGSGVYPALYPSAIGVSAITSNGQLAGYSDRAPKTLFALPGDNITSLAPGGGFAGKSGTSMATPHCTGAIAVMHSTGTALNAEAILSILCNTADSLGGHANKYGCGNIRLDRAVYAAQHPANGTPIIAPLGMESTDSVLGPTGVNWVAWSDQRWLTVVRRGNWAIFTTDTQTVNSHNMLTKILPGAIGTIKFGVIIQ